ncbi:MAG: anti-sigma factor family protein [Gemmatimonadota bacterium]
MLCDCNRFLQEYSEYRDGALSAEQEAEFREHVSACPCCARYDRVLRAGSELLSSLPSEEPAEDFMPRLAHRLYNVDEGLTGTPAHQFAGAAALVGVAAVGILALFWLPFAAIAPVEMQLDPVAAYAPAPGDGDLPSLFRSGPFIEASIHQGDDFLEVGGVIWQQRSRARPRMTLGTDSWLQASASLGH